MRIAIDIPTDLAYAGDPDWRNLCALRDSDTDTAEILGVTYTEDTIDAAETAFLDHWQDRLAAAAEQLGHEILFTGDAAEAHDWTAGQDGEARIEAHDAVWSAA